MAPTTQKAAQYDHVSIITASQWDRKLMLREQKTKKVVINTIPVPKIVEDEILIRTVASSLCHSDIVCRP